ncbi:hypothetical protein IAQ61_010806, partial [Plenodomus lingam]|uniref:uncharacterized protein n=1 Tax=Leptosphaeria maculans TaxID=5022 RepID=UPI00332821DC
SAPSSAFNKRKKSLVACLRVFTGRHSCGSDLRQSNRLDFSGASLDSSHPFVVVTASHRYPGDGLNSKFGLVKLYTLGSGSKMEITESIRQSEFPEIKSLVPIPRRYHYGVLARQIHRRR